MDNMKIEVSNGEILDKVSILELKIKNIDNKDKLINIEKEFYELSPLTEKLFDIYGSELQVKYLELANINNKLWIIEDNIRECEKNKNFGEYFVKLARDVVMLKKRLIY